jgi:hypothetical protein
MNGQTGLDETFDDRMNEMDQKERSRMMHRDR